MGARLSYRHHRVVLDEYATASCGVLLPSIVRKAIERLEGRGDEEPRDIDDLVAIGIAVLGWSMIRFMEFGGRPTALAACISVALSELAQHLEETGRGGEGAGRQTG